MPTLVMMAKLALPHDIECALDGLGTSSGAPTIHVGWLSLQSNSSGWEAFCKPVHKRSHEVCTSRLSSRACHMPSQVVAKSSLFVLLSAILPPTPHISSLSNSPVETTSDSKSKPALKRILLILYPFSSMLALKADVGPTEHAFLIHDIT